MSPPSQRIEDSNPDSRHRLTIILDKATIDSLDKMAKDHIRTRNHQIERIIKDALKHTPY